MDEHLFASMAKYDRSLGPVCSSSVIMHDAHILHDVVHTMKQYVKPVSRIVGQHWSYSSAAGLHWKRVDNTTRAVP